MLSSISRRELIHKFKALGYSGPFSGGKHQFMIKGRQKIRVPNPHGRGEIDVGLLKGDTATGRDQGRRMGQGLAGAIEQWRGFQNGTFVVEIVSTFPVLILSSPSLTLDSRPSARRWILWKKRKVPLWYR
jgi:hypothetical protein